MVRSRTRNSVLGRLKVVGVLMLLALVFPASALAHTPAATVSCTGSQFTWTDFRNGTNTVHWRVTVDGATFQEGTTTFQGNVGGSQTVPYTLNDTHTVQAYSWWDAADTSDGNVRPESSARARLADTDLPRRGATGESPPAAPPAAGNIPAPRRPPRPSPAPRPRRRPPPSARSAPAPRARRASRSPAGRSGR